MPTAVLFLLLAVAHADAATAEPPAAGDSAPAFTLPAADGGVVRLADLRGRLVVIEWIDPTCPYSARGYERDLVAGTIAEIDAPSRDVVYLAVNSSGDVAAEAAAADGAAMVRAADLDERVRVLVDHDGDVARAFGARTTPHVFVIDRGGMIRYSGAYTDDPRGRRDDATNYVVRAVRDVARGRAVAVERTDPWGCRVRCRR